MAAFPVPGRWPGLVWNAPLALGGFVYKAQGPGCAPAALNRQVAVLTRPLRVRVLPALLGVWNLVFGTSTKGGTRGRDCPSGHAGERLRRAGKRGREAPAALNRQVAVL